MSLDEIKAIPVAQISARNAALFMWITSPLLDKGTDVMKAWGFKYVSSIVWVKDRIGTGYWVRSRHEYLLVGRRGPKAPLPKPALPSVIEAPRREHSRKPDQVRDLLSTRYPADLPKLEMFARCTTPGWTTWGNETNKFEDQT